MSKTFCKEFQMYPFKFNKKILQLVQLMYIGELLNLRACKYFFRGPQVSFTGDPFSTLHHIISYKGNVRTEQVAV